MAVESGVISASTEALQAMERLYLDVKKHKQDYAEGGNGQSCMYSYGDSTGMTSRDHTSPKFSGDVMSPSRRFRAMF